MHSYEELRNRLDYQTWISNYAPSRRCPNGESELEFTSRVTAAAVNLFKGENAIVFCHGGTISAIMAFCFSAEGKNRWEWQPDPGQGYSLILKNGMPVEYRSIPRISNIGGGNVIKKVNPLLQSAAGD
ncbi:hypothetical protein SDC9_42726 [bioreactor metagenome]|uniref:Uncharacterized protein n=1 Tax=bioreactor metagenome TaxID=1076179 RepID=A0A644VYI0_9ZZZZ